MKVALCLSGYFSSQKDKSSHGKDGFEHIKKNILSKADVDVFMHCWNQDQKHQIEALYAPYLKASKFEKQIDFKPIFYKNGLDKYPIHGTPFYNIFSQFYSIQESFKLFYQNDFKQYDFVIKSRFDLGRINRYQTSPLISLYSRLRGNGKIYPVQCINFDPTLNNQSIYFPRWAEKRIQQEGLADMWYYSSPEKLKKIQYIFDFMVENIKNEGPYVKWAKEDFGGPLNAIKALKYFFIKNDLWNDISLLKTIWS
ncbi:MAG: hypothetical protein CBB97_07505 [Candidatus Endolissoclinum sp. TMED37]|nr:MAG: hypothetical protein CBB97_07505 [Candidatus Endolissoclinum sp. TMED37]